MSSTTIVHMHTASHYFTSDHSCYCPLLVLLCVLVLIVAAVI
jgi:hypothetical protein